MSIEAMKLALNVYMKLDRISISGGAITGYLDPEEYSVYKPQLEAANLLNTSNDDSHSVEYTRPGNANAFFAFSLDDLLEATSRQLNVPEHFCIADMNFIYGPDVQAIPLDVKNYLSACRLAKVLVSLSDHAITIGSNPKAIFLHGEKLELTLSYNKSDLKELTGLDQFIHDFVDTDLHNNQKTIIIKTCLLEMLKSSEIHALTLPALISRFKEFIERVRASYYLYVSEFSFEKIKEQVEKEVLDFTFKINKVLSDIQNQVLAVPVALILVGSQMKPSDEALWQNTIIYFGSLIFGIIMAILIRNQRGTLSAIKKEMKSQWITINNKHRLIQEKLGDLYGSLNKRYYSQYIKLLIVDLLVSSSIFGVTLTFLVNVDRLFLWKKVLLIGLLGGGVYLLLVVIVNAAMTYFVRMQKTNSL